jgi:hypothetical protein
LCFCSRNNLGDARHVAKVTTDAAGQKGRRLLHATCEAIYTFLIHYLVLSYNTRILKEKSLKVVLKESYQLSMIIMFDGQIRPETGSFGNTFEDEILS